VLKISVSSNLTQSLVNLSGLTNYIDIETFKQPDMFILVLPVIGIFKVLIVTR